MSGYLIFSLAATAVILGTAYFSKNKKLTLIVSLAVLGGFITWAALKGELRANRDFFHVSQERSSEMESIRLVLPDDPILVDVFLLKASELPGPGEQSPLLTQYRIEDQGDNYAALSIEWKLGSDQYSNRQIRDFKDQLHLLLQRQYDEAYRQNYP